MVETQLELASHSCGVRKWTLGQRGVGGARAAGALASDASPWLGEGATCWRQALGDRDWLGLTLVCQEQADSVPRAESDYLYSPDLSLAFLYPFLPWVCISSSVWNSSRHHSADPRLEASLPVSSVMLSVESRMILRFPRISWLPTKLHKPCLTLGSGQKKASTLSQVLGGHWPGSAEGQGWAPPASVIPSAILFCMAPRRCGETDSSCIIAGGLTWYRAICQCHQKR